MMTTFEEIQRKHCANAACTDALAAVENMLNTFCGSVGYTRDAAGDDEEEDEKPSDDVKRLHRQSIATTALKDLRRGYLLKRKKKEAGFANMLQDWKRRYFVLNQAFLYYFENEDEANEDPLGFIDIQTSRIRPSDTLGKGRGYCFEIVAVIGNWLLQSPEGESETRAWQKDIESAGEQKMLGTLHRNISDKVIAHWLTYSRTTHLRAHRGKQALARPPGAPSSTRCSHTAATAAALTATPSIPSGRRSISACSSASRARVCTGRWVCTLAR
jgi:hypothetical protein